MRPDSRVHPSGHALGRGKRPAREARPGGPGTLVRLVWYWVSRFLGRVYALSGRGLGMV